MTKLMEAVKSNDIDAAKALLDQGANVDELEANGDAPLIMAAYLGHAPILEMLLNAKADVSVVDPGMKATALHAAAYAGRTEAARLLVKSDIDIDKQGPMNGYTALHDAIWQNNIETARVLIEAGAALNIPSHSGETALEMARSRRAAEIASMIEQKLDGDTGDAS